MRGGLVASEASDAFLLGDDVRRKLVFEPHQPVAQQELSFLEPLHLQLVSLARRPQRRDRRVEVAVLLAKPLDLGGQRGAFLQRDPLLIHPCASLR